MITIASAMQQEEIKALLESYDGGDFTYKFSQKQGIKLVFEVTGDKEEAAKKAKELIKAQPWGGVLYFQAAAV
ncbi:hypothetical protein [Enterococcus wangshanyuanii]|uniref:SPOR domain-containing protein n=1 Tax=Enterococcus wangshanyuanii TaxID=2005703 RepID=A0ABQ1PLM2_9ENTE|nr:hypothetical protein [Enterococcus wangshanyuanii]GGC98954.1 hypothetical protein GCM10011573_30630 [Enterococcus wangshanyuanii]